MQIQDPLEVSAIIGVTNLLSGLAGRFVQLPPGGNMCLCTPL